jgi:hypothetical protein
LGVEATARLRRIVPPPQELVQPVQSYQLLHAQSTTSQAADSQAEISSRGAVQPCPPLSAPVATLRLRVMEPLPQRALHSDHSSQLDKTQSPGGVKQRPVLQEVVSRNELTGHSPSLLMAFFKYLVLNV